jgi:hypothetical protein
VLFLAVVGVSWLLAGVNALYYGLLIGAGLIGLAMYGGIASVVKPGSREGVVAIVVGAGYLVGTFGLGLFIAYQFARADVHVDNNTDREVRVALDGRDWVRVPARGTEKVSVRKGRYRVVATPAAAGAAPDEVDIHVTDTGPFVLNLFGAQVYARGKAEYGGLAFFGQPAEVEVKDRWFRADVDFLFQDAPEKIEVEQGEFMASRTYLRRGPPRPARGK